MSLPAALRDLRLPVIAAPMFLVSGVDLVVAQCQAGIVGSFPSRNARSPEELAEWIREVRARVDGAPFAVNLVAHPSNPRFGPDAEVCAEQRVPLLITSMSPPGDLVREVHGYGGLVFHDVSTLRHARKAVEQGVDGLILVCAGAGGHAGTLSPFAFVPEVRQFYSGPLVLGGSLSHGRSLAAARMLGADLCYLGTRFIATKEAASSDDYKQMVVDSASADIVYTPYFSGIHANYLIKSVVAAGIDPAELAVSSDGAYRSRHDVKAWRDIWGAGQGVGAVSEIQTVADVVGELLAEYRAALSA